MADIQRKSSDLVGSDREKSGSELEKDVEFRSKDNESSNELHLLDSNTSTEYLKSRGVKRIENVKTMINNSPKGRSIMIGLCVCLLVVAWAHAFDSSTTYNYSVPATSSFNRHSMISTLSIATSLISSIMKPILGKMADITSRPWCYALSLVVYTVGTIIAASSSTIGAYIVGEVLTSVGVTGISFMNSVIVADLTTLKWRGLMFGILSTPYLINTWFAGLIVQAILKTNWRWGFGMFAIIMPVVVAPAVTVIAMFEHKAQKLVVKETKPKKPWTSIIYQALIDIDALGLILLGFGWSLLLLPFSLYSYADNGWKNPSIIAMIVTGFVILVLFVIYENTICPKSCMPSRVLKNKTFIACALIDAMYLMAGQVRGLYLSTIVWVTKDISNQNWTYFNNIMTMSLCSFGVLAGVICRVTHRYKYMQVCGLAIKVLGYGLAIRPQGQVAPLAAFIMAQIIIGFGGSFGVIGTQLSSQASVPHEDMTLVMGMLSLFSNIGSAIGSCISGPIWTSKLPGYLREFIPETTSDVVVRGYFTNVSSLRALPYDSPDRQGAIKAYSYVAYYLFIIAVCLEAIEFLLSFFQTNFYLGDTHNAVEDQHGMDPTDPTKEAVVPQTRREKLLGLFK